MINLQNLLSQTMMSKNPQMALLSLLNPQQLQLFNQLQNQPNEKQAEAIAQMCNEKGITKEQLAQVIQLTNGSRN